MKTALKLSTDDERKVSQKIIEMARLGIHGPNYDARGAYNCPIMFTGEEKRIINLAQVYMDIEEREILDSIEAEKKTPGRE